jgi:GTP-binding protein
MTMHYQKAQFVLSAARLTQLPVDTGIEIALIGRSNSGKSSVLNRLTRQKQLARVSKTPGRTQLINVFQLDHEKRLIDLPGYGFAKAPEKVKDDWEQLVSAYFKKRLSLKGILLIMDIRHPLKPLDEQVLAYCKARHMAVHVLLNKADKLTRGAAIASLHAVKTALTKEDNSVTVQLFSALRGTGMDELENHLNSWYRGY